GIDFTRGWGVKLIELLDTLETANVAKATPGDLAAEFENWRATMVRTATMVEEKPEPVLTNLLAVRRMPERILFHEYEGDSTKIGVALKDTGIPYSMHNRHIVAFADASRFQENLSPAFSLTTRAVVPLDDFLNDRTRRSPCSRAGRSGRGAARRDGRRGYRG